MIPQVYRSASSISIYLGRFPLWGVADNTKRQQKQWGKTPQLEFGRKLISPQLPLFRAVSEEIQYIGGDSQSPRPIPFSHLLQHAENTLVLFFCYCPPPHCNILQVTFLIRANPLCNTSDGDCWPSRTIPTAAMLHLAMKYPYRFHFVCLFKY